MAERRSRPRVLIAGGGLAAIEAMLALRALANERWDVELLTPARDLAYRPLATAAPFGLAKVNRFDVAELAAAAGASVQFDALTAVDAERGQVRTAAGKAIPYDRLLMTCGANVREAFPGALTFWGRGDEGAFQALLVDLEHGAASRVVFAVPAGVSWALPLYELALMTAAWLRSRFVRPGSITIATHEERPLEIFGHEASADVAMRLARSRIRFRGGSHPVHFDSGQLKLVPSSALLADAVVSLPALQGHRFAGLPHDQDGFVPVDAHGRVDGLEHVFAAGDVTSFPVKQGGLATQQADAAAEAIAASLGADLDPRPFRPVLRGVLFTGEEPTHMSARIDGGHGEASEVSLEPLWQPSSKVIGRYLSRYLDGFTRAARPRLDSGTEIEMHLSAPDPVSSLIGA
jgi:sulfide:quinone oxidoreductase